MEILKNLLRWYGFVVLSLILFYACFKIGDFFGYNDVVANIAACMMFGGVYCFVLQEGVARGQNRLTKSILDKIASEIDTVSKNENLSQDAKKTIKQLENECHEIIGIHYAVSNGIINHFSIREQDQLLRYVEGFRKDFETFKSTFGI